MHKLQEQTVTQIIIPFVQMIIPFSHPWNGKKKKGEALLILEYRKVTRFDYKSWWSSNNSNAVVTLKLRLQSFFFLFLFYSGLIEMRIV